MSVEVLSWWAALCTVGGLNVTAWLVSARVVSRGRARLPAEAHSERQLQLLLSAGYVFGCAFRSFVPVYDVPRLCLFDSWLSSVMVGRSVATVAELCFAAQWGLLLRRVSLEAASSFGMTCAWLLVPLIAVAEAFSWYSVLTTSNIGHVVEESLWGLCAALFVISMATLWPRCARQHQPTLALWCVAGLAYVGYMFLVDVPMYWSRWLADEAAGRHYMNLAQGLADVSGRWTVSHRWEDWRTEVVWMSLYFSVAVWISLALVHVPAARPRAV